MREQVLERGGDLRDFPILSSRPALFSDLIWVWEAFTQLSGARQVGFNGPLPLSMSEVLAYAQFRGIESPDEREELLHFVQYLDKVWLEDYAGRKPKK